MEKSSPLMVKFNDEYTICNNLYLISIFRILELCNIFIETWKQKTLNQKQCSMISKIISPSKRFMILIIAIISGSLLNTNSPKSIMLHQKKDFKSEAPKYHLKPIFWMTYKDKKRKYQDHHTINLMFLQDHYLEKWINSQEKQLPKQ